MLQRESADVAILTGESMSHEKMVRAFTLTNASITEGPKVLF
jgi:hypothetical protein